MRLGFNKNAGDDGTLRNDNSFPETAPGQTVTDKLAWDMASQIQLITDTLAWHLSSQVSSLHQEFLAMEDRISIRINDSKVSQRQMPHDGSPVSGLQGSVRSNARCISGTDGMDGHLAFSLSHGHSSACSPQAFVASPAQSRLLGAEQARPDTAPVGVVHRAGRPDYDVFEQAQRPCTAPMGATVISWTPPVGGEYAGQQIQHAGLASASHLNAVRRASTGSVQDQWKTRPISRFGQSPSPNAPRGLPPPLPPIPNALPGPDAAASDADSGSRHASKDSNKVTPHAAQNAGGSETENNFLGYRTSNHAVNGAAADFHHEENDDDYDDGQAKLEIKDQTPLREVAAEPSAQKSSVPIPLQVVRTRHSVFRLISGKKEPSSPEARRKSGILEDIHSWPGPRRALKALVTSQWFEYLIGVLLLLNAISVGVRAQYRAEHPTKTVPDFFPASELFFCVIFTVELVVRIYVFRCSFLQMKGWQWNAFDLVVVSLQVIEAIFDFAQLRKEMQAHKELSLLRLLRLGRVVRLLRMVRLVPALKSMVYLIAASMSAFLWTLVLLSLLMFGVAVHLTETIADYREDNQTKDLAKMEDGWGSVLKSITSLYQAILGGIDWKELMDELNNVSWSVPLLFAMYVAFASLVMLNLVTGVFVEGAQRIVAEDRDLELVKQAQRMFAVVDDSADHAVSWTEFESHLNDQSMAQYFKAVGISIREAKDLFHLLDMDHSGTLSIKEFVNGCLSLRGPAKSLDLARLAYNHEVLGKRIMAVEDNLCAKVTEILEQLRGPP